ncbi:Josephin domain [Trinorchestia longiramus]|nr:Josephin domain [Trinorchestia longiramus]
MNLQPRSVSWCSVYPNTHLTSSITHLTSSITHLTSSITHLISSITHLISSITHLTSSITQSPTTPQKSSLTRTSDDVRLSEEPSPELNEGLSPGLFILSELLLCKRLHGISRSGGYADSVITDSPFKDKHDELDKICQRLSPDNWFNPHKSMLGTGNYDINVIIAALEEKGCAVVWFDKRKDPSIIALELVKGFILNIPSDVRVGPVQLPLRRKHWVAVKEINGSYYNLDSKLDSPVCIGQTTALMDWLREQLSSPEKELFVVASQEVEKDRSWSLDAGVATANNSTDLVVSLPSEEDGTQCHEVNARLAHLSNVDNVDGTLDVNLQKRLLAPIEGEEAFSSPGLKFIDHDAASVDSANSRSATTAPNVPTNTDKKCKSTDGNIR